MSKNVLEISVRSDIGGGPKHLLDLLSYNQSGHKLFCAIPFGYELSEQIKAKAVESIEIPHRSFSLIVLIKLINFCKKNNITVVHSHGRGAGYYSRLMKLFGFKIIHTLHGVHIEEGLINKIKLIIDQVLVSLTDKFICVSNGEKEKALKYKVINKSKTTVIFNGVLPQTELAKRDSKIPRIAMLGRLSYPKGYDLLIDQIEIFIEENPNLEFIINIAGDGEDKESLLNQLSKTKYAKDKIHFVGSINNPIDFLKKHTHFLSFSRFEGLPISVLEAMSVGLPCMVTDVVGNNDIINARIGLLFQPQHFPKIFFEFITSERHEKSALLIKEIKEKYQVDKQVSKITDCYS